MRRAARLVILLVCPALSLSCSGEALRGPGEAARSSAAVRAGDAVEVRTRFTRMAPRGYVDLSLDVENPWETPVTLEGRLVARDGGGAELPDVRVRSAFGTETGRAVVMPGGAVDFVRLQGPGADRVREVTLEDTTVTPRGGAVLTEYVDLTPVGGRGEPLEYDMYARGARLENPNPHPARIRVVLMVLRAPRDGVPQEATLVHDVTTAEVPADGTTTVPLDAATRRILRTRGATSFVTLRPVLAP